MAAQSNKKIKVVHFGAGNLFGGIEVMLVTLAKYQNECTDLDQSFAFFFDGKVASQLRSIGFDPKIFQGVKLRDFLSVRKTRRQIANYLSDIQPEAVVVHGQWVHHIVAKVVKNLGIRLIHWSHDPPNGWSLVDWSLRLNPPDFFVCNSLYTKSQCDAFFKGCPKTVIHCPVEDLSTTINQSQRDDFRRIWGTAPQELVFLHVARWERHKGHLLLIDAAAQLFKSRRDWKIWFVGEPQRPHEVKYQAAVLAKTESLGLRDNIKYLGWQSQLSIVLGSSDVYCQPNIQPEPFGISIVEAMYAGLPVISTPLGGPAETVDSSCGIFVEPGDVAGLTTAMQVLFDREKHESMSRFGKSKALNVSMPASRIKEFYTLINSSKIVG